MDRIWRKVHGNSLQALKPNLRQIIQKVFFEYWATNEREAKIANYRSPVCERCQRHIETTDFITCGDIENRKIWLVMTEKIQDFFK